jgi:hypothetical protein
MSATRNVSILKMGFAEPELLTKYGSFPRSGEHTRPACGVRRPAEPASVWIALSRVVSLERLGRAAQAGTRAARAPRTSKPPIYVRAQFPLA